MSNHEFMLYCYKTSFCPISNSTIHDWSKCNYAHRQQDFRRSPYLYFYYPERCPNIAEDGSWDGCENELECDYSHTLVEILFNPLHYKIADCPEKTAADKYKCAKHKERCCHAHSTEEKKLAIEVLESLVPKVLPQKEDIMQYYLEALQDYVYQPSANTGLTSNHPDEFESANYEAQNDSDMDDHGTLASNTMSKLSTAPGSGKTEGSMSASAKKARDQKAAANLEEESDLQRQKFLDTFQQMQESPATQA